MLRFDQYIRKLRLATGSSFQDLAAHLDSTPALLRKIEQGQAHATKDQVFKLADYFGEDVKEMLITYQRGRMLSETEDDSIIEGGISVGRIKSGVIRNTAVASKRYQNMRQALSQLRESQIQVKLHQPSYPLRSYIESIVYCKGHHLGYPFEKVLPDGVVQLILALDDRERLFMAGDRNSPAVSLKNAWVTGIQKQHHTYQVKQSEVTLYIRFRPGGFHALTHIPQSDLENAAVEADLLLGRAVLQLREAILACRDTSEMFHNVEQYFLTKFNPPGMAQAVIEYMCRHSNTPLPQLVRKTGYSQKHLIQLFKKHVGVTPKYFQRIYRFNNVVNHLHTHTGEVDWAAVAFDHHYYDQAHFIREFRHFSGSSPQGYLEAGSTCAKFVHTHSGR